MHITINPSSALCLIERLSPTCLHPFLLLRILDISREKLTKLQLYPGLYQGREEEGQGGLFERLK